MIKRVNFLFIAIFALSFIQCNLSPEIDINKLTPEKKSFEKKTKENSEISNFKFWEEFNDSNLNVFVNRVKQNSIDIKNANLLVEKFKYLYQVSKSQLFPDISLGVSGNRSKTNLGTFLPQGGSFKKTTFSTNLNISYEVDIFKKLSNYKKQNLYQYLETEEIQNGIKLSIIANAISIYLSYSEINTELEITKEILNTNKLLTQSAKREYISGTLASELFLNLKSSEKQAENLYNTLYENKKQLEKSLKEILSVTNLNDLKVSNFKYLTNKLKKINPGLPSELLLRRPDIKAAYFDIKAKTSAVGVSKAALFPSIKLTGSDGFNSTELSALLKSESNVWNFGINIFQPIFNRGALKNKVKISEKELEISINNYRKTVINAFSEIDFLLQKIQLLEKRIKNQEQILKNEKLNLLKKHKDYVRGSGNFNDYLTQRINYLNSLKTYNRLYLDYFLTRIALYKALGGGIKNIKTITNINEVKK